MSIFRYLSQGLSLAIDVVGRYTILLLNLTLALTIVGKALTRSPIQFQLGATGAYETTFALGLTAAILCFFAARAAAWRFTGNPYALGAVALGAAKWVVFTQGVLLFLWALGDSSGRNYWLPSLLFASAVAAWVQDMKASSNKAERSRVFSGSNHEPAGEPPPSGAKVERPQLKLSDLYGNEALKGRLLEAAQEITAKRASGGPPRNGILMHGHPGNGKTAFAEALAGELQLPLVTLTYASVASMWVGEKSSRVRRSFEEAIKLEPCMLFIDEIDSFLESRDGSAPGQRTKEDTDLVNALLTLTVDIRKSRVILVAATNHLSRLDSAGIREGRFDFKVEITAPDKAARAGLLRKGLKDNVPNARVEESVIDAVAGRWNGFSVKRILAVTEELPSYLRDNKRADPAYDDFMGALRRLQGQRGHVPEEVKPLAELVLSPRTRDGLDQIVGRMVDPEHTERHGGTLPSGVLFYGPPGTGKTAASKALAKELQWAYLPATGADLASRPSELEALYAKAMDLRPAMIFIDEADELLRDRAMSASTQATNKLLTLMDGVGDRVRDVVWIAATNNPEQIDPALLRGGRFTDKILFEPPSQEALVAFVEKWLTRRKVHLASGLTAGGVTSMLGAQSIANAEAMLQGALNRAITRRVTPVAVTEDDVRLSVDAIAA